MKKIILTVFAATSLLLYSTPSFAISLSVGVPIGASLKNDDGSEAADGASGYFLGVQLPFGLGLGMDSHKTKIKDSAEMSLSTSIYNLYYQLPVPVVNLILGFGTGSSNFECDDIGDGRTCEDFYTKGAATQWYTSIGIPLIPFFDIHLSYRSITNKNIKDTSDEKSDVSSTMTGVGLAFNF
jgi:hypothetical protein